MILLMMLMVVGLVLYLVLRSVLSPQPEAQPTPGPTQAATATPSDITQIIGEKAFWPTLSADGQTLYYLGQEGKVFTKADLAAGKKETLLTEPVEAVNNVWWSPGRKAALVSIVKDGRPQIWFYNFTNSVKVALNPNIDGVIWSPDGTSIIYHYLDLQNKIK